MEKRSTPLWLLPNLLSIDAPLVAVAWLWMYAQASRIVYVEWASWLVLPAAVWCVYVVDRLLDGWRHPELRVSSPRHRFHWRFRWGLLVAVLVTSVVCVYHAFFVLPRGILSAGIVAMVACGFYFVMAFFRTKEVPYLKNFAAGMIFAMGVGIPINAVYSNVLVTDFNEVVYAFFNTGMVNALWNFGLMFLSTLYVVFVGSLEVWVFGLLCMMNITAIDLWEKAQDAESEELAYRSESTLTLGLVSLAGGALFFAGMVADEYAKSFFYAAMVGAALLQVVNHFRERLSMNALRVLADVSLLAPVLVFWAL